MNKKLAEMETVFKALADSTRLRILGLLLTGEVCVCHVHESLKIAQPKASRHLAALRHAGLVTDRRVGTWSFYSLSPATSELERSRLESLRGWLAGQASAAQALSDLRLVLESRGSTAVCANSTLPHDVRSGAPAGKTQPC